MARHRRFATENDRWNALQKREPGAALAFIYGVTTTRIFCRPTCPARLARRANVVFFDTVSDALSAGFRACKRCKPEEVFRRAHEEAVKRACEALRAANGKTITLETLAGEAGLSSRYFHGVFKKIVGVTPREYAAQLRIEKEHNQGEDERTGESNYQSQTLLGENAEFEVLAPETRIMEQLRFDWSQLTPSAEPELLIDMDYEAMMSNLDVYS
ncbi:hypothetical protein SAPIO_CDS1845 [Scedosporium apiospermum]|uniref:HTH araC/xylS-type domain-containing protein n=1 Tax=Pseudallescheria apiosperma TaxID=563466 RepID=A0A084GDV8_PSEDA|nr:uncharacterized protein SAPIO_CDS1845 [Scedosporium apiospermum]KEZ45520.1 hypothetical protein SAPIO_CDS1845 [Scedosporium apiospermum]